MVQGHPLSGTATLNNQEKAEFISVEYTVEPRGAAAVFVASALTSSKFGFAGMFRVSTVSTPTTRNSTSFYYSFIYIFCVGPTGNGF